MSEPLAAPHTRAPLTLESIMRQVMLAAAPATLFGIWLYGWPAFNLVAITLVTVILAELLCLRLAGRPTGGVRDGSALVTGLILAMSLPPWAPWWIAVTGGLVAIIVAKGVFGGTGQNLFNPAMVARVALLIAFPVEMTRWVEPAPLTSGASPGFLEGLQITFLGAVDWDAVTSATTLDATRTALAEGRTIEAALPDVFDPWLALLGYAPGSLAESSALLLLAGGIYLLARRIIAWDIPIVMLVTLAVLSTGFHVLDPDRYASASVHILAGSTLLAAFFIATDPSTSPATPFGRAIFAAGCAAIIWLVRTYGGYPEASAFAVLLMNCFTPIIDHYLRPRIYGRDRLGNPLNGKEQRP
ncbi:electron transport complex protein RnfD [Halorhodospira halochloris]|uniref:Ion-translocating oxidoreductase complex subunit D n=1 Tax=Halorhodospira halochloris TaxID=1052 RepID=A0A0X8X9E0_HALHR|nr:RnfABCDGE type electron transport complex subunit D [Halorhodospira halochloris]MBK1652647.1 electron transporter RnfD [Halorhodospira halochloris]BAU57899.1 electron transport complex protein RnfD [Halorhodospira halochloris]